MVRPMLLILAIGFLAVLTDAAIPCNRRDYGLKSFVCVCNDDTCDTIDPLVKQPSGEYIMYTSDKAEHRFHMQNGKIAQRENRAGETQITIDRASRQQEMLGFGAAFTDSTGIVIDPLSDHLKEVFLQSYFGKEGLEYNWGRVPMGGTDFGTHSYSYDDTVDEEVDETLEHFALQTEDFAYKLPLIKRALEINPDVQLMASAWTAPKWMKTNGKHTGGAIKYEFYQLWADYFIKFFDKYAEQGVHFWALTTGNEPSLAIVDSVIVTVGWFPTEMRKWIGENLGPTLRNSSYSDLKLFAIDDQRFFLPWFPKMVIKDEAAQYVDGIALHWYWDFMIPPITLDWTHEAFPDLMIMGTESCIGNKPWENPVLLGDWYRAELYAHGMLEDFNHHVNGWIDFNFALDLTGGPTYIDNFIDAPVIVNATAHEFYKQPMYYALGHFAKFLPRGSHKIKHTANNENIEMAAFERTDSGIVVVLHNRQDKAEHVVIRDAERGVIEVDINPKSINTIVYW